MTDFGPEDIQGIVPPMTTPFSATGAIDEAAFRAEARFLLDAGVHGAIAAILTAAPRALVALWDAVAAGDHASALDLHGRLLALWNAMLGDNLPAAVKAALDHQGIAGGLPRRPMPGASAAQREAIAAALGRLPQ